MYAILTNVFLSAVAGLMWCLLVMFFCMCVEHLFFKKVYKTVLDEKEVILLKELLAGHISLPCVADDGIFTQCVDHLEMLFSHFTNKSERMIVQLENMSNRLEPIPFHTEPLESVPLIESIPLIEDKRDKCEGLIRHMEENRIHMRKSIDDILDKHGTNTRGRTKSKRTGVKHRELLSSDLSVIEMPSVGRNIFRDLLCCQTVHDVLLIMLRRDSRKALLEHPSLGTEAVHALELFMVGKGLLKVEKGRYSSDYWDEQKYIELHERVMNVEVE